MIGLSRRRGVTRKRISVVLPPMSDDFATSPVSGTKWPNQDGGPTIVSGRLRVVPTASYPGVASNLIFNIAQYPLFVEVPTLPIAGNGTIQTRFIIANTNYASLVEFQITSNPRIIYMAGIGPTVSGSVINYSATDHRWLRFRYDAGNLLWETSPDKATWTVRKTVACPSWLTSAANRVVLQTVQTGAAETSPGYAEFDNFNV